MAGVANSIVMLFGERKDDEAIMMMRQRDERDMVDREQRQKVTAGTQVSSPNEYDVFIGHVV